MILTNQWTEYSHGHARTELRLLKEFLTQIGISSQILSSDPNFGDIHSPVTSRTVLIPKIINRGPVHRWTLKNQESQLARMWESEVASIPDEPILIVSSGFWPQLVQTLKKKRIRKLIFRLISPPEVGSTRISEVKHVLDSIQSQNLILGIETLDGVEYLRENFGISATFVPPLSPIGDTFLNSNKIGIIWSVTDTASISEISAILNQLDSDELVIKLPIGVKVDQLTCDLSRTEIIPNGISDELFAKRVGSLESAYLPHRNYKLRGSGLVATLLGSGVNVLAHEENSFIQDFRFSKLLFTTNDSEIISDLLHLRNLGTLKTTRNSEAEKVRDYIRTRWHDLVVGENA